MSFVIGFLTGMATGESLERRKARRQFRDFMKQRGFTVVDQRGKTIPIETLLDEILINNQGLLSAKKSNQAAVIASVAVVAIAVITGGAATATVVALN